MLCLLQLFRLSLEIFNLITPFSFIKTIKQEAFIQLPFWVLKKKKTYYLENGAFMLTTAIAYYCMIFTNLMELYYVIPALLCYTFLIIMRFHNNTEFDYFVIVKDIYRKETKVKINAQDRPAIGKQIDSYLNFEFNRILEKTKN